MMTWSELKARWLWALISDAEFIEQAAQIGHERVARELVNRDLETK